MTLTIDNFGESYQTPHAERWPDVECHACGEVNPVVRTLSFAVGSVLVHQCPMCRTRFTTRLPDPDASEVT